MPDIPTAEAKAVTEAGCLMERTLLHKQFVRDGNNGSRHILREMPRYLRYIVSFFPTSGDTAPYLNFVPIRPFYYRNLCWPLFPAFTF